MDESEYVFGKISVTFHPTWRGRMVEVWQEAEPLPKRHPRSIYANVVGRESVGGEVFAATFNYVVPGLCRVGTCAHMPFGIAVGFSAPRVKELSTKVIVYPDVESLVDWSDRELSS